MIKVLVVDDSAIVRDVLSSAIEKQSDMELVGTAPDPFVARDKIVRLKPDVITLDIEMPRMDGLSFLERLMHYFPLPVIIVSSVTTHDPYAAVKALELGAFDVVNKPGGSITVEEVTDEVLRKIRAAYEVRDQFVERVLRHPESSSDMGKRSSLRNTSLIKHQSSQGTPLLTQIKTTDKLIAIGASTGGTVALEQIFRSLPAHLYPIVVVQHMPQDFTRQFAQRLHELSQLEVKEGEQEEMLQAGTVYIAPGGNHMEIVRKGASLFINLNQKERIHFQRPAVDVLFRSVAREVGKNALGILLTGMGRDGAEGLLAMKKAGAQTIAQDEDSSIVWGMPRAAVELGAATKVLPLSKVPQSIIEFCV
ncbi:protein-glutamate methylesterase/protein-glutamine glutaminase [Gracilinema caldarium]|uniref:Protein-glutamate methylesterase/protein-glutamine glutaminase n=1 Tax=Gracilinema caldarium (strain ATCC 51460 / DSM 7334 / H1) TaxID=744872 RepID=F8F3T0_GRAC1|nr:chemotaxis response regulator protein-glutamate methylesterase [Gracilinema caldarium]AEJ20449.1 response regulator receiver modulated CheB methylesterase [Gracilinema caldarium DSM 7334]